MCDADCNGGRVIVYTGACLRGYSEGQISIEKHGVPFEEAATVFSDANGLDWDDVAHSLQEQRFKRLDFSVNKRLLLVAYTIRRTEHEEEKFRIISARPASRRERQAYSRLPN